MLGKKKKREKEMTEWHDISKNDLPNEDWVEFEFFVYHKPTNRIELAVFDKGEFYSYNGHFPLKVTHWTKLPKYEDE